jgi:hypothetical protein
MLQAEERKQHGLMKIGWQILKQWLDGPRSISAGQLSQRLARERQVFLGAEQVRRILKKKAGVGKD